MKNQFLLSGRLIIIPFVSLLFLFSLIACNDQKASITEEEQSITTYPFGDPNPIPAFAIDRRSFVYEGRDAYPYYPFNQYSLESIEKEWNVITLENDHIEVSVLPEVGGKVEGAIEKSTGNEFLYKNDVLKFRDIAVRGAFVSGGIHFNFATFGHGPHTATPVDYLLRENEDGSVSVFVGTTDLASRSEWRVEIKLPEDKAYFETDHFWYTNSRLRQHNYMWSSAAIEVNDDLQYVAPGDKYADHQGNVYPWPIDEEGRDLSWYRNNDFGYNKPYHVFGEKSDYYGAYWHDKDFGVGNWSLYSDKPGTKLWVWALSRAGGIMEDLLTDESGQYSEIQSGRYFTQAAWPSTETPFNHDTFAPLGSDQWEELWFPVKKIGGIEAASPYAVLNRVEEGGQTVIKLMALQTLSEELDIYGNEELLYSTDVSLQPLEVYADTLEAFEISENMQVILGDNKLIFNSNRERLRIDRPTETELDDDIDTASRIFHRGRNQLASRDYSEALGSFATVIEEDPAFTQAYVNLSDLHYRRGEYQKALEFSRQALSHNTYNEHANYIHGVVHARLGNTPQAIEAFGWAARAPQYRSAAYSLMAEMYLRIDRPERTEEFANRSLENDHRNINAQKVLAIAYRKNGMPQSAEDVLDGLLEQDPLNHFARFERYLLNENQGRLEEFTSMIRNELPHETYLELGLYYASNGLNEEAIEVLSRAPSYPMVDYWLAYLHKDDSPEQSSQYLQSALESSPYLVFPFRLESIPVLEWAGQQTDSWKNRYYLGLIHWYVGREETAATLFDQIEETSDYAPFYIARGELRNRLDYPEDQRYADLMKANELDREEWRTWLALNDYYMEKGDLERALNNAERAYEKFPDKEELKMDFARALLKNGKNEETLNHLDRIHIIPIENFSESREIYEKANIFYAVELINESRFREALTYLEDAKRWPETLGVGRPYNPDHRLQQYLEASLYRHLGEEEDAEELFSEIADYTERSQIPWFQSPWGAGHFAGVLAANEMGNSDDANRWMNSWIEAQPDNHLAQWAEATFHQETNQIRQLGQQIMREEEAWSYDRLLVDAINSINRINE